MTSVSRPLPEWPLALRRYLWGSFLVHLVWEVVQLPLYTLWTTGTSSQQAFAILHCTAGDTMIAGLALLLVLSLINQPAWPAAGGRAVWVGVVILGVGYTLYSEWLNVTVRQSWAYSEWMPLIPVIGIGLSPILQWFIVPTLVLWLAAGRPPWTDPRGVNP